MSPSPLAESDVRSRLQSALDDIKPSSRPLADVRRAIVRRRRRRQAAAMVAAGVLVAVGISVGLAATGGSDGGRGDRLVPEVPAPVDPTLALNTYVTTHKATSPTHAVTTPDGGTYAADIEAGRVHVLSFDGHVWSSAAELGSPMPGPPVVAVHPGPDAAGDAAAFQVDEAGGDAVYNGVIVNVRGGWSYADFDCGTTAVACAAGGHRATTWQIDATEVKGAFHSEPNSCTPSCVAGTRYDVTWRWDGTQGVFVVASSVKVP
jgi:hypothetical protein